MFKKIMALVLVSSLSVLAQQRLAHFSESFTIAGERRQVSVTKEHGRIIGFHWRNTPLSAILHSQIPFTITKNGDSKHIRLVIEDGRIVGNDSAGKTVDKFEDIVSYSKEERENLGILKDQPAQEAGHNATTSHSAEIPSFKGRIFSKKMFFGIVAAGSVGYLMKYIFAQSAQRRKNNNDKK